MLALLIAGAVLLGTAGAGKALATARPPAGRGALADPAISRSVGVVELLVAVISIAIGGRLGALLLAAAYAVLAAAAIRLLRSAPGQDCGCFARPSPIGPSHVVVNLAFVGVGVTAMVIPAPSLIAASNTQPLTTAAAVGVGVVLGSACYLTMTALPPLLSLVATKSPRAARSGPTS